MSTLSILLHILALVTLCGWVRYRAVQRGLAAAHVYHHWHMPRRQVPGVSRARHA